MSAVEWGHRDHGGLHRVHRAIPTDLAWPIRGTSRTFLGVGTVYRIINHGTRCVNELASGARCAVVGDFFEDKLLERNRLRVASLDADGPAAHP